jgi:hypothetical protein
MRFLVRVSFLGSLLLMLASVCPAQKFIAHVSSPAQSGYQGGGGYGYGGGYDTGYGYYPQQHHNSHGGDRSSFPRFEPTISYAHGEAEAVPSRYMEYEQALALGKQMLEEEAHPKAAPSEPSLGEIARQLRQGSRNATPEGKVSAIQDGNGQLVICHEGNGCRG